MEEATLDHIQEHGHNQEPYPTRSQQSAGTSTEDRIKAKDINT